VKLLLNSNHLEPQTVKDVRSGIVGHVAALESTSAGICDSKLQLTCQCVNVHPATYLDLEVICGIPDLLVLTPTTVQLT
jgi:hypothetical protein